MGRKGPIPERWEDYKPVGKPIKGTRFIAFKVPLRPDVYEDAIEPAKDSWLDHDSLLDLVPNLGLIIDLTFTWKYYPRSVFTDKGVRHLKIMFEGRKLPKPPQLKIFKDHVEEFLQENKDNDKLIGVHCTHGVNRTGFIICHHLITAMNMPPEKAIKLFEKARGHPIEREIYTDFLKRIGNGEEIPMESDDRQLDLNSNGRNRNHNRGNDRRQFQRNGFFNRDYDDDNWRAGPRNFDNSTAQRTGYNWRQERNYTANPAHQGRSNYYDVLSRDSSNGRDSDNATGGRIDSNKWHRNNSSYQQTSRNGWNHDNYQYQRYASRDDSSRNGRNRDNRERYDSKDKSPRNGRNHDNYRANVPRDESSRNDNYQRYAPKDESSHSGRKHINFQAHGSKDDSPRNDDYQSQDRTNDTRRRFEMRPESAHRRFDPRGTRPIRSQRQSYRDSPIT